MSFFRVGEIVLSTRLQSIKNYYQQQRTIWDIGCDHGQLGLSFITLDRENSPVVHLVDPSDKVISTLKNTLKDSYITNELLFIHHGRGQDLILNTTSNCIFIAGMGGKEIGEITLQLLPQLRPHDQIIISPHRGILALRVLLNSQPIKLLNENVVFEDEQFYQILSLVPGIPGEVSLYGETIWQSEVGEKYRLHQLNHFSLHQDPASKAYVQYLKASSP